MKPLRFALELVAIEEHEERREASRLIFNRLGPFREQVLKPLTMHRMQIQITDAQQFDVAVSFTDKRGNPATLPTPPTWGVSDGNLLTVTPAADGLSATVKAVGPVGTGQVTLAAEGDPTPGVDPLTGALDVVVVGSEAANVVFSPSAPTAQP